MTGKQRRPAPPASLPPALQAEIEAFSRSRKRTLDAWYKLAPKIRAGVADGSLVQNAVARELRWSRQRLSLFLRRSSDDI